MGQRIQDRISYISIKAVQYGVPILSGAGGIGLTLDSLLRSKNEVECGIGVLLIGVAVTGAAFYKTLGRIAESFLSKPQGSGRTFIGGIGRDAA